MTPRSTLDCIPQPWVRNRVWVRVSMVCVFIGFVSITDFTLTLTLTLLIILTLILTLTVRVRRVDQ